MKTSVTKMMMSFALMGCLIIGASDASAQGRSRSQGGSTSSRSQSAAVSRSNNASAPTVSRNSSSNSSRSSATPQVSRSSSSSSRSSATPQVSHSSPSTSRSSATPKVSHSSSTSSMSHSSSATPQVNKGTSSRPTTSGATPRVSGDFNQSKSKSVETRPVDRSKSMATDRSASKSNTTGTRPSMGGNNDHKPDGNFNNDRNHGGDKDRNGNMGNDRNRGGGKDRNRPNGNNNGGNHHGGKGKPHGNGSGYGSHNHFNYSGHHYYNDFHRNYTNHSWSWSRPLPPPVRHYRPVLLDWYRPVIPYGWHPYTGAPIIDRILGLTFGTLFNTSIDYLYYNGFEIDGYADHVIYLRDVSLINYLWEDVMLYYDDYDRLVNAQFIYHSPTNDRYRYDRIYNSLCRVYGTPITNDSRGISWYGGDSNGWVTLSTFTNLGHYYTTLSIGY